VIERSDTEEVEALPVLAPEPKPLALAPRFVVPAVQTAAAAAGGLLAGVALVGIVHRRHGRRGALAGAAAPRRLATRGRRPKPVGEVVEVVATRSLLVDVHLLGSPARGR
jgi:hypothetical protein